MTATTAEVLLQEGLQEKELVMSLQKSWAQYFNILYDEVKNLLIEVDWLVVTKREFYSMT